MKATTKARPASMMKIAIEFDADQLIDDVMANFPEYSTPSLTCIDWDYKACTYQFWDTEVTAKTAEPSLVPASVENVELRVSGLVEGAVTYHLDRKALRAGMELLLQALIAGDYPGVGRYVLTDFKDAGNWDSDATDLLLQFSIFGAVIYG